jgi:Protein of unknown function (DUF1275)
VESVSDPLGTKLLTFVLSVIAGSVDVIGFLGLGTLFIAHITGNLVILAARYAAGEHAPAAHLLSVPVFMIVAHGGATPGGKPRSVRNYHPEAAAAPAIFAPFRLPRDLHRGWLRGRSECGDHDSCCHARRFRDGHTKRSCATLTQGCAVHCGDDDQLDSICTGSW